MSSRARRALRAGFPCDSALSPASRIRIEADVHSRGRHSASDDDSGCVLEEYAWVPSGLRPDMVHSYFACLPDDKVPYVNSPGEKWRQRQLRYQLPPQDSDARYCGKLTEEEESELWAFERARKQQCLGRGVVDRIPFDGLPRACVQCRVPFDEGEVAVFASRVENWYHPACFVCMQCEAPLVDLVYFSHQSQVYCGRHHAEQIKPRCAKCDELIFAEECTEAEGRTWHIQHFQCAICQHILGGRSYMLRNGRAVCTECPQTAQNTANNCASCNQPIPDTLPRITQESLQWHTSDQCFCCCVCGKNLLGKRFSLNDRKLYCGARGCRHRERRHGDRSRQRNLEDDMEQPGPGPGPGHSWQPGCSTERERPSTHRSRSRKERGAPAPRLPSSRPPQPPPRAPPPPPTESIYETVLPCGSSSPDSVKCSFGRPGQRDNRNYYSKTPSRPSRYDNYHPYDHPSYSTSSDSSDDDDLFYVTNLLQAASLNRNRQLNTGVQHAKMKKQNRCIVS